MLWGQPDQAGAFLAVVDDLPPVPVGPGSPPPWPQQAALVLAAVVAGWQDRWRVAVRSGRERRLRGRVQGQVLTLARLVDA